MSVVDRLKKVVSYSELQAIKTIISELGEENEKTVINSKVADKAGITRSIIVNAFKLLEVTGIVETRSLGMKGTRIKVLDREVLEELMR